MNAQALNAIDFYKSGHGPQYPENTELVYSNWTPRSTKHAVQMNGVDQKIVVFGLQYFIQWYLIDEFDRTFFSVNRNYAIDRYKRRMDNALGPDVVSMDHIGALWDVGYLPLSIQALPEGSVVDARTTMLTVKNTLPEFFWLTNYIESVMSCMLWGPCTSATIARAYRQILDRYAIETTGSNDFVKFQGHDFSFRGMYGLQAAMMSGMGHLAAGFVGTDTVPAIDGVEEYYGANSDTELVGCSVPATEHSVMCMGTKDDEIGTFRRLITELYPNGPVSIVSDTWDFWQVLLEFLPQLKGEILARKGHPLGLDKVVIRPDSGDPVKIICGDPDAETEHERKGAIEVLWDLFGGKVNDRGYRELDPHIGLIYGDSITLGRANLICKYLKAKGFASTNVVLGIGSFTYQFNTRDTYGFAMKATAGRVNGEDRDIFKDPKTDDGLKKSAKGFLAVFKKGDGDYVMVDQVTEEVSEQCELKEVFRDGELLVTHTLAEIRDRVEASLK